LSTAFSTALTQIALIPRPGTAAASASSNPNVSTNNNYILNSSFQSVTWFGDLTLQLLNPDGTLSPQQWSAMQQLDCATTPWQANFTWAAGQVFNYGGQCYLVGTSYTSAATFNALNIDSLNTGVIAGAPVTRTIYTANTTKTALIPFAWGSLSTAQQAYFTEPAIAYNATAGTGLSQFCSTGTTGGCLTSAKQTNNTISPNGGRAGEALVKYLAGDRTYEGVDFRARAHVLGDIVSSEARYVQTPSFSYSDSGYASFQSLMSSRAAAVYVAANDGMLHAFNATNGQENWTYIPSAVLPNLYQLADLNYGQTHRFMTDATPEVGDICPTAPAATCSGSQWKTILVAGLNAGGKGYYALDITNPTSPVLLWEFNDSTLGYTYGNPRITKLQNGTWVVILSSGDNNSDGVGRIYVLNAATGAPITAINGNGIISTATGSAASPSGLSRMAVDVLYPLTDNTAQAVYAGDLLGNLWRFDVNNTIGGTGYDAQRLVSFIGSDGQAQPITDKPSVARINGTPVVFVGTGRYLGVSDIANTNAQSFYAVKDTYGSTSLLNPRATASGFVQQTLTATTCPTGSSTSQCSPGQSVYTSSNNTVNWTTNNGWFIDFPNSGERSVTDPSLGLGTLAFTTIKPIVTTSDPCGSGAVNNAQSYLYYLNYLTGAAVTGANSVIGISLGAGLATRPVLVKMADGSVRALIRQASGALGSGTDMGFTNNFTAPITPSIAGTVRRVSWRELNGM
jgi:type IV pilus assembly protein PilY1